MAAARLTLAPTCEAEAELILHDPHASAHTLFLTETDLADLTSDEATGRRLMMAAAWVLAGDGPSAEDKARGLLADAAAQQHRHIARLEEAALDPQSEATFELLLRSARPVPGTDVVAHLRRLTDNERADLLPRVLDDARSLAREIDRGLRALSKDPSAFAAVQPSSGALEANIASIRRSALRTALVPALAQCLSDQDEARVAGLCARALGLPAEAPHAPIDRETMAQARLLAGSLALLGYKEDEIFEQILAGREGKLPEIVAGLRASRAHGDDAWGGPGDIPRTGSLTRSLAVRVLPWLAEVPEAEDAASARAQVRGILRSPRLFYDSSRSAGETYRVSVAVTGQALRELLTEDPSLELGPAVQKRRSRGSDPAVARPELEQQASVGEIATYAMARQRLQIGSDQVEVRYLHWLDSERLDHPDARAHPRSRFNGWLLLDGRPSRQVQEPLDLPEDIVCLDRSSSRLSARRVENLRDAVGSDDCSHPYATWRAVGHHHETARLACPRCLRLGIASVPMHRLPDETIVDRETVASHLAGHGSYLALERLHRQLAGDDDPVASIAELRERDGLVDPRGEAYASISKAPTASRAKSVRAAMNRR